MPAQPIHCDRPGDSHLADVLISPLDGSATTAWCNEHYLLFMVETVNAVFEAEAAATAAEAAARLEAAGDVGAPPTSGESSDVADPPAVPPTSAARRGDKPETAPTASPDPSASQGPDLAGVDDSGDHKTLA